MTQVVWMAVRLKRKAHAFAPGWWSRAYCGVGPGITRKVDGLPKCPDCLRELDLAA